MSTWQERHEAQRRRRIRRWMGAAAAAIVVVVIAVVVISSLTGSATFTVTDKTVKRSDGKDMYLVFTDRGTFKDTDNALFLKFGSSDLYGKLQRGKTYKCKTFGTRVKLTSSYPNLISCDEVRG